MSELSIRQATLDDVEPIFGIWSEGFRQSLGSDPPDGVDFPKFFLHKVQSQDDTYRIFVAEHQGEIVGWVSLSPFRSNPAVVDLFAELSLYAKDGYHNLGIGKELLQHCLAHADHSRLQFVVAFIAASNRAAMNMGMRAGFLHVGTLPRPPKQPNMPEVSYNVYPCKPTD
jgi:L-amino acid N-acyltransferase YncA